jgi:hypothetical protein
MMNWAGFYIYSLASTAMVDPKAETERLESHCGTNFRIWKLAKSLAALAGLDQ